MRDFGAATMAEIEYPDIKAAAADTGMSISDAAEDVLASLEPTEGIPDIHAGLLETIECDREEREP